MKRVVITGLGAITPVGNSVNKMWQSIRNGVSGIDKITLFDTSNFPVKYAAEVKDYLAGDYFKKLEIKKMARVTQFAVISAQQAYNDANLENANIDRERFSVFFGSGAGGGVEVNDYTNICGGEYKAVSKMMIPKGLINMVPANIAIKLKAYGTCIPIVTACSTGTDCIGMGYRDILQGYSDVVVAGGAEAYITPVGLSGFNVLGAIANGSNPDRLSIPFDKERNGFVMGEGAGAVILEELEHAKKRNAKIYGEILGYATSCDAYSLVAPDISMKQGARAIKTALENSNLSPDKIDYFNAHGTGTKMNDSYETKIIKEVFGEYSGKLPISSTKSMTGHLLGASGAVEAVIICKAMEDSYIPPTIGYSVPDEECDLDYVPCIGRSANIDYAVSNSLGFGGHNSALVLSKNIQQHKD